MISLDFSLLTKNFRNWKICWEDVHPDFVRPKQAEVSGSGVHCSDFAPDSGDGCKSELFYPHREMRKHCWWLIFTVGPLNIVRWLRLPSFT